ncbi:hypothetical protein ACK2E9_04045 [Bifidobacterium catenulatum]|uniref:hypothetical protein n=1 Tax=Bifidobacterium catenulatum TaxID=1686 RepID=UPI003D2EC045
MSAEVDEIIPVSHGGSATDLCNLEKVHCCCNQLKSDKTLRAQDERPKALRPSNPPPYRSALRTGNRSEDGILLARRSATPEYWPNLSPSFFPNQDSSV